MKRLALIVSLAAWAFPTPASGADYWQRCGIYGNGEVLAHQVACPKARDVIRRYYQKSSIHGTGRRVVGRFQCRGYVTGSGIQRYNVVRCHKGTTQRIRYKAGE